MISMLMISLMISLGAVVMLTAVVLGTPPTIPR